MTDNHKPLGTSQKELKNWGANVRLNDVKGGPRKSLTRLSTLQKAIVRTHPRRTTTGKITTVREHQTRRAKRPIHGLAKLSAKEKQAKVNELAKLSLKELRRRQQDTINKQHESHARWEKTSDPTEKEGLVRAAENLNIMERMLTAAVEKRTFSKSITLEGETMDMQQYPALQKATIRAHTRRTKSGMTVKVREHQKGPLTLRDLRTNFERRRTSYEQAQVAFRTIMSKPEPVLIEARERLREDQERAHGNREVARDAMISAKNRYVNAGGKVQISKTDSYQAGKTIGYNEKSMDLQQFPALQKAINRATLSKSLDFNKKGSEIKSAIVNKIAQCQSELAVMVIEWKAGQRVRSSNLNDAESDEVSTPSTATGTEPPEEPYKVRNKRREIEDLARVSRNVVESKTYKISEYELKEYGF